MCCSECTDAFCNPEMSCVFPLSTLFMLQRVLQCDAVCCSVLQCDAVCCSVLQCDAVCCSVLQCDAVCCSECTEAVCEPEVLVNNSVEMSIYVAAYVAVRWCTLHRVAVCCSVLQCVAVCCSVLQCFAVCCGV